MARAIGTLGTIDTVTTGGRVFTDLQNLVTLFASITAAPNIGSTFRSLNSTSGYQVAGTPFIMQAVVIDNGSNLSDSLTFGYADNDIGLDSSTSLTNPVYIGGDSAASVIIPAGPIVPFGMDFGSGFSVPVGKYPFVFNGGSSSIKILLYGVLT